MNKTIIVLLSAVILLASGVLGYFAILTPEQVKAIWQIVGPLALAMLGLQNASVTADVKALNARMLPPPAEPKKG